MKHCRIIYIDQNSFWWLAEAVSGNPKEGAIKLIEPYALDLKEGWNEITKVIGEYAEKIILFFEEGIQCHQPLGDRVVIL